MLVNSVIGILWEIERTVFLVEVFFFITLFIFLIFVCSLLSSQSIVNCVLFFVLVKQPQLESVWSILPMCFVLWLLNIVIFCLLLLDELVCSSLVFDIVAFQWYWSFMSVDCCLVGVENLNIGDLVFLESSIWLVIPVDTLIRVFISSVDVIHSFSIPSFGVKLDAIVGRINCCVFYSECNGIFFGQCTELCGSLHGFMPFKIVVV